MKGLTTDGPCSSRETPTMVKPLSAYFFLIAINPGISARQAGHQQAQKSRMITFPLKSATFTSFPSSWVSCQSGAAIFGPAALHKAPSKRKAAATNRGHIIFKLRGAYLNINGDIGFVLLASIAVIVYSYLVLLLYRLASICRHPAAWTLRPSRWRVNDKRRSCRCKLSPCRPTDEHLGRIESFE